MVAARHALGKSFGDSSSAHWIISCSQPGYFALEGAAVPHDNPMRVGLSQLPIRDAACWLTTAGRIHVERSGPYQNHLDRSTGPPVSLFGPADSSGPEQ